MKLLVFLHFMSHAHTCIYTFFLHWNEFNTSALQFKEREKQIYKL